MHIRSPKQMFFGLVRRSPAAGRVSVLLATACLTISVYWIFSPAIDSIEERIGALGWTLSTTTEPEQRIALVVIDEASVEEIGPWPWARSDIAALVRSIDDAGAQLQIHDISYPEARPGDADLAAALSEVTSAIIAQVPAIAVQEEPPRVGGLTHPLSNMSCGAGEAVAGPSLWSASGYIGSAPAFQGIPKGHNAAILEADGSVRRSPAVVCVGGRVYPSLSIYAFLQLGSAEQWQADIRHGSGLLESQYVMTLAGYPGLDVPLDSRGAMRVSFARSPEVFRAISAADVMAGRVDVSLLQNAWVLVGGTAFGMADIVPTPYSGATYGLELQARLLTSLLDMNVPYTPIGAPAVMGLLCLVFAGFLLMTVSMAERLAMIGLPLAALLLPFIAALGHGFILANYNLWLGWVLPALYGSTAALALLLLEMARIRLERSRVFNNLNSYLPDSVAHDIAFSLPSSSVEANRTDVTLLNADLRNFSRFSEARAPEEAAMMLHFFFTRATEIVEAHGGELQEFKGDGVLAIWHSANSRAARCALDAAAELTSTFDPALMSDMPTGQLEPLALGVGIEQGPVLIGSIGPSHRRTHTVLGDTVSITLRIQEMTSELAQPILIGECAARQLGNSGLSSQGSFLLTGLTTPHTLFAPATASSSFPLNPPHLSLVRGSNHR